MDGEALIVAINTLLGFLPEHWKPHVEAVLAMMSMLSVLLAAWRPLFAWIAPRAAGSAVYVWFDRTLDWLSANSRRIEVRKPVMRARLSNPPSKRKSTPPGPPFGFIVCLALGVLLAGCAGTLEQRTRGTLDGALAVAELSYEVASEACDQVHDQKRCAAIDDAYQRIADIGEMALRALDNGDVAKAQDMYRQIAALLRSIGARLR